MDWLKDIKKEELPRNYLEMTTLIEGITGKETAMRIVRKLSEHFSKQSFYFRSLDEIVTKKKKTFIIERFTGSNHAELARATNFSIHHVYDILKENNKKK